MDKTYPKIALHLSDGIVFTHKSAILYAEAEGNYTHIFLTDNRRAKVLRKLKEVHDLLPDNNFIRVHRSYLLNLHHVVHFDKEGNETVVLTDGSTVPISRNRRSQFMEKFTKI